MRVVLLYATVVLIWGSTFAAIPYQLGVVAVEWSVAYRFGIASVALMIYAIATGRQLSLPRSTLPFVMLQGVLLFSLNYFLVYYASAYIATGLIAVLFTFIILANAFFERLFFGARMDARFYMAAALGVAGIALIFWPEVTTISLADDAVLGILLALSSMLCASLGNMAAHLNTRRSLPLVALNAQAMGLATLFSAAVALSLGRPPAFSFETPYVLSLLYLSLFGSAVAFGCYLALMRTIGPSRAAYSTVMFPAVALLLSTLFEGYEWTMLAAIGILLALFGNILVLRRKQKTRVTEQI